MRVVVALGGNALLKRGEPMTAEHQRANVRVAAEALARVASGPRARHLARQRPAGRAARPPGRGLQGRRGLPARHPRRGDAGDDRLPHRAGARQPAAVRAAAGDDPDDGRGRPGRPGVRRPDQVRRADLRRGDGQGAGRGEGLGRQAGRRALAARRSVAPAEADLRDPADALAARARGGRHLRRRRRHPDDVRARRGPPARSASRPSSTRTSPAACWPASSAPTCTSWRPTSTACTATGARPTSAGSTASTPEELDAMEFPAGSMGPKVDAAVEFATATGKRAAIGSLEQIDGLVAGTAGTNVAPTQRQRVQKETTTDDGVRRPLRGRQAAPGHRPSAGAQPQAADARTTTTSCCSTTSCGSSGPSGSTTSSSPGCASAASRSSTSRTCWPRRWPRATRRAAAHRAGRVASTSSGRASSTTVRARLGEPRRPTSWPGTSSAG